MNTQPISINIQIIFYSMYGHTYKLAEAIAEGVRQISNAQANLYRVPELVPQEVLIKSGAFEAQRQFQHVTIATIAQLKDADAIIFGTPTRFGNMCAQMRNFLDQTGSVWVKRELVGKVAGVFASTGTQHGGQETTITSFHSTLLHHGMIIVGVPYTQSGLFEMKEISGGTPYGATTIANSDNLRQPSANELDIARYQGKYIAELARIIKYGRFRCNCEVK